MPRLPPQTKVDVTRRHACHAKRRWMSPSATATQNAMPRRHGRLTAPRRAKPSATSATRQTKVDVAKCHTCHAKRRWMSPSATATPATRSAGGCRQAPRLPRKVPRPPDHKCHTCHAKRRWMSHAYHTCHAKCRWMSPSAPPATQSVAASRATNGAQARHQSQPSSIRATPATHHCFPLQEVPPPPQHACPPRRAHHLSILRQHLWPLRDGQSPHTDVAIWFHRD